MPLSLDNIIQSKTGSFESTSGTVSLDTATTAGSAVIICGAVGGTGFDVGPDVFYELSTPTNFVEATSIQFGPGRATPYMFVKKNVGSGETSWTLPVVGGSQLVCWVAMEVTGIGLDPNLEYYIRPTTIPLDPSVASTRSTSTTPASSSYDTVSIAMFAGAEASSTIPAWSGYTNGYAEFAEVGTSNASRSLDLAVALKFSLALGTTECTASVSPDAYSEATVVTFYADTSRRAPDLAAICGFEYGTTSGMTTGSAGGAAPAPWDGSTGSPTIGTTTPRTGTYYLELSSSAAAEAVTWSSSGNGVLSGGWVAPSSAFPLVARAHVYFPTSLPSGDVPLLSIEAGSLANGVVVRYVSASQKIGVQVGTGSEVLSDATVAADKWVGLDVRYDARNTTHLCDWQVDYDSLDTTAGPVEQTQASNTGMTVATISTFRLGWTTSSTATVRYDDIAVSKVWGAYPLGDMRVRPIKVDPAGTPTVSGTATNFKVMTANGTMGAFDGAGARNAVDEIPPTIGASADGIAQVAVASNDYVNFPMENWTAAPTYVLRALRSYLCGWADSGNPASIGYQWYDGSVTVNPASVIDHGFDNATAVWLCRMVREVPSEFYLLTQTKLTAFAIQVGLSLDATPDVGFHAIFAELAYQPADVFRVGNAEDGTFTLDVRQDPYGSAVASLLGTSNHATRGCTITATINGTDYTQHVNASSTYEWQVGASSISEVTAYGLIPDA